MLFLLLLFLPPLLLLVLLLLLLDSMYPSGPLRPPLDSRDLGPFVYDLVTRRSWAIPGLTTDSDRVALFAKLGRLGGSLVGLRTRHAIVTGGWQVARRDMAYLRCSRRDLIATSGWP
jgi:hypothetical protein